MTGIELAQRSPEAPPELPVMPGPGPDFPPEDEPPAPGAPELPAVPETPPNGMHVIPNA